MNTKLIPMWDKIPGPTDGGLPEFTYYEPAEPKTDAAVVIFPGGAYLHLAEHEGKGYAEYLAAAGYHAFVCRYRVRLEEKQTLYPWPLVDARRAVRLVRKSAAEYGIDPGRIAVMGSSAGGHLVAMASTYFGPLDGETSDEIDAVDCRPNATISCYGVVAAPFIEGDKEWLRSCLLGGSDEHWLEASPELNVTESTPPAFLWNTSDDPVVNVIHLYKYATALREHGVPHEVHVFPHGSHGMGLGLWDPSVGQWGPLMLNWLRGMWG